jgi:hypothetical protein
MCYADRLFASFIAPSTANVVQHPSSCGCDVTSWTRKFVTQFIESYRSLPILSQADLLPSCFSSVPIQYPRVFGTLQLSVLCPRSAGNVWVGACSEPGSSDSIQVTWHLDFVFSLQSASYSWQPTSCARDTVGLRKKNPRIGFCGACRTCPPPPPPLTEIYREKNLTNLARDIFVPFPTSK